MKTSTKLTVGALAIAMLFLLIGFTIGRLSTTDHNYGVITGSDEQQLVGKWRMSIKGDDEPWIVEFQPDRTTIRYDADGQPTIIATWGIIAGELSIQNAHDPAGGYMPPNIFKVASLDGETVDLLSGDKNTQWVLEKIL